jgi:membrane protein implicated in regulation of membrane protease activity
MESFSLWWAGLSLVLKIYWGIAIPFTVFFLLQLIASFLGGGDAPDHMGDAEVDADHGIPLQFLTLKNLVGFFTIFSWTGIACSEAGFSQGLTLFISALAGLLMVVLMAGLYYLMSKASADGTMKIEKAIGQSGEVYLTVPAKRKSMGKVQIKVSGALRTLEAMTDDDQDLPTGKIITVSKIVENILVVTGK